MKFRSLVVAGVAVAGLAAAPASHAALSGPSVVTGVGTGDLSISVPATVASLGFLVPGDVTEFTPSAVAIIAPTASWALKVKDATNAGQLQSAGGLTCTGSASELADPLNFTSSKLAGPAVTDATPVAATDTTVASGTTLLDTVTVAYTQDVGDTEAIADGCAYSTTLTYTIAAS
jgi:hypothetical protein